MVMVSDRVGGPPLPYCRAWDGLRGLAVLAVLAYHSGLAAFPGGFLGVDVFLVLSGYLITSLLFAERVHPVGHALVRFWVGRARRLLPALVAVSAAVTAVALLTAPATLPSVRADVLASLGGFMNWRLALGGHSYFEQFEAASLLRHAWSLGVEMQWYLLWPLVLVPVVRRGGTRVLLVAAAAAAAAAAGSALLMALQFDPGTDPSRLYYGTDTRAQQLLTGAALALLVRGARRPSSFGVRSRRLIDTVGVAALAAVVFTMTHTADLDPRLYRGGLLVVSLLSAAVVLAASEGRGVTARVLGLRPLVATGRISYGLYLWHWPVFLYLIPGRAGLTGVTLLLARVAATFALALASYHLVELPVRRPALRRRRHPTGRAVTVGLAAATAGVLVVPAALPPTAAPPAAVSPAAVSPAAVSPAVVSGVRPASLSVGAAPLSSAARGAWGSPPSPASPPGLEPRLPGVTRVLVAGDSVAMSLAQWFDARRAGGVLEVDYRATALGCGVVGGRPYDRGRPLIADPGCERWLERWSLGATTYRPDVAVVLVGAWEVLDRRVDGRWFRAGQPETERALRDRLLRGFDALSVEGARVLVLTTPCFRSAALPPAAGESDRNDPARVRWFNAVLARAAREHPAVAGILDLHGMLCPDGRFLARRHGTLLRTDGVHFTPEGARLVWDWIAPHLTGV